ncbi:EAL domain-containing protein [Siculibacillus lacustris]|uniref:EAL domain-containing protein n=1 Tax=Siculibacillus lacustris TaxID=1549641 RepID=A0A4Q9VYR3_9HYPH|nr:EAL domain-containing protein [Siculibacillus lacustris]TBW41331.1 EAL domain-containing protein [Siculibacillus lacustris]
MENLRRRWARSAILALALIATVPTAERFGLLASFDRALADRRSSVALHEVVGDVVLVDIDARSLSSIGVWPWPRRLHGALVEAAARLGARRIAFDVDFSSRAADPADDAAFAAALAATPVETLLAAFTQPASAGTGDLQASLPIAALLDHAWPVAVNAPTDPDGAVRRFPYTMRIGAETVTSLPALLAGRTAAGTFGIDYTIDRTRFPRISYVDLLEGRVAPAAIAGKTLIVAATAIELHDFFPAPGGGIVFGSTILALATETLLQGRELTALTPPPALEIAIAALLAFAVVPRRRLAGSLALLLGLDLGLEVGAFALAQGLHVMLATAGAHLLIAVVAVSAIQREFGLRRLLLWVRSLEVRNGEAMIDRLVDEGFDAVLVFDDGGRIRRINHRAVALLGLAVDGTVGQLPPSLADAVGAVLGGTADRHARTETQLTVERAGDRRIVDAGISAFDVRRATDRAGLGTPATFVCVTLRDVTEREQAYARIRQLALEDQATGLPNRNAVEARLARPEAGAGGALVLLGLDRFRKINERLGHGIGDRVLNEVAGRLVATVGADGFVARLGADEFAVVVPGDAAAGSELARRLTLEIARPMAIADHRLVLSASAGVAAIDPALPATARLSRAESALRDAKRSGAGSIACFDAAMDTLRRKRLAIEFGFAAALDAGAFEVVYQPQVSLATRQLIGVEALVRWTHPTEGPISPALFVAVAEETGMIHRLGAFVLERACRDAMTWPRPITVAVNVSPIQFQTGDLVAIVERALAVSGLAPTRLQLEMTESAFVHDGDTLRASFDTLTGRGITFALDDFGTGYSSLSHLTRFPISKIKIDRAFVTDVPADETSMAVLRSVMALAEGLGAETIAEGIETEVQARVLTDLGCRQGQGFLFSRGVAAPAIAALMRPEPAAAVA